MGVRSVSSILGFVFDELCIRVTSEREVGYGVLTEEIIGSKVSKMKQRVGKLNSKQTTNG